MLISYLSSTRSGSEIKASSSMLLSGVFRRRSCKAYMAFRCTLRATLEEMPLSRRYRLSAVTIFASCAVAIDSLVIDEVMALTTEADATKAKINEITAQSRSLTVLEKMLSLPAQFTSDLWNIIR